MTSNKPSAIVQDASRPAEILIALGANIPSLAGPPAETLAAALAALERADVTVERVSSFHQTEAWPDPADPPFTNAVAVITTPLQAIALLTLLHEVETAFGRKRSAKNAPRTLDLDLLDHRGEIHHGPLFLPHPRIAERRFVLAPLLEVAPHWHHPVTGLTAAAMLTALPPSLG